MDKCYVIVQKTADGSPGRPVGDENGAIAVFEDSEQASKVLNDMKEDVPNLGIFRLNISMAGEVLCEGN